MSSANNALSLESVWQEYQKAIRAFLLSKVSNPDDVEDIQQEILIKTYKNLAQVQDTESIKPWLFQIANRTIIDFYRKRARTQRDSELEAEELWFEETNRDIQQEMAQCITPFINALPEDQAKLMSSIEIEGISQKQLAEESGVSYSTLKSRVQRNRSELRKLFEACCHLSFDAQGNLLDYTQKSRCSNCGEE